MNAKHYTKQGLELKQRQIKAQEVKVRAIGREAGDEAGLNCDWHDNFGYEDAKRRLEMESALLRKLREDTDGAQVITVEEQSERVGIGTTAKILFNGEDREITLGGFGESDAAIGLLSYTSPLGRVLLNMREGDSKTANIVGKPTEIEVVDIRPPSYRYNGLIAKLLADVSNTGEEETKNLSK
jgi:transcription elongation factor GreA